MVSTVTVLFALRRGTADGAVAPGIEGVPFSCCGVVDVVGWSFGDDVRGVEVRVAPDVGSEDEDDEFDSWISGNETLRDWVAGVMMDFGG